MEACTKIRFVIWGGENDLNDTWELPLENLREPPRLDPIAVSAGVVPGFELRAPHPNPSPGNLAVEFALPQPTQASLAVFDASGRCVRSLAKGSFPSGTRSMVRPRS